MWSPLSRDYIAGVIAESGARGVRDPLTGSLATSYRTKAVAEAQGVDFVHNLGVSSIDELRQVPMDELLEYVGLSDTTFEGTQFETLRRHSGNLRCGGPSLTVMSLRTPMAKRFG